MGIANLVRGRAFRNFMAKLYGWGASVVILGALFKINHYPGADMMLVIGLGTEAIIFFFSAFEPPHVEPDWSLVYPELAGMYHGGEVDQIIAQKKGITGELDKMLKEADIDQQLINSLGMGLKNLSDNTSKLADVSDAALATQDYAKKMKTASTKVEELSDAYKRTADALNQDSEVSEVYFSNMRSAADSAVNLSNTYNEASKLITAELEASKEYATSLTNAASSVSRLNKEYNLATEILTKSAEAIDISGLTGSKFSTELQKVATNLTALNAAYELQLQRTGNYAESAGRLQETMDKFLKNLNDSADQTAQYRTGLDLLAKNVAALNNVYGNMLSAMNISVNK